MDSTQYLLIKLAEEAAEIAQIALKSAQFGLDNIEPGKDKTNAQRIHSELNDLSAVVDALNERIDFQYARNYGAVLVKREKMAFYEAYSRQLGLVHDEELKHEEEPAPVEHHRRASDGQ